MYKKRKCGYNINVIIITKKGDKMDLINNKFYIDDFFDKVLTYDNYMKCDIYEIDNTYHIEMELAGLSKEDIKIDCSNGYLNISCEKHIDDNKKYIRRERVYKSYNRSFYIGDLDINKIEASFNNGILHIMIPKENVIKNDRVIDIK